MTILLELREAARTCSNKEYADCLRTAADCLGAWLDVLAENPTRDAMRRVNGEWAAAERVLKNVPAEGDPAPLSGPSEPARLAA